MGTWPPEWYLKERERDPHHAENNPNSSTPEEIKTALDAAEDELHAQYRKVWKLREAYAETWPPAALPSPRNRTDKQALIARCPRCGGRLDES